MEMASWDGGISRTVQFLVPQVSFSLIDSTTVSLFFFFDEKK